MTRARPRPSGPARARLVAFLRAINVGGHIVRMEQLRAEFEALGLTGVETFIASGNVVFDAPSGGGGAALERRIEGRLREALGYDVDTFVRTLAEVDALSVARPFPAADLDAPGHTLYIGFLPSAPNAAAVRKVAALKTPLNDLRVKERELFWLCRGKLSQSELTGAALERALGLAMTLRNVSTLRKLTAKYAAAPAAGARRRAPRPLRRGP